VGAVVGKAFASALLGEFRPVGPCVMEQWFSAPMQMMGAVGNRHAVLITVAIARAREGAMESGSDQFV
jgi:hypothetical protein